VPNPSGLCRCGCGAVTPRSKQTVFSRNTIKGEHVGFLPGHTSRSPEARVRLADAARRRWREGSNDHLRTSQTRDKRSRPKRSEAQRAARRKGGKPGRRSSVSVGDAFGRLVVVSRVEGPTRHPKWLCLCRCGKTATVQSSNLRNASTRSCGCLRRKGGPDEQA
jgi:hypothetical protein